MSDIPTKTYPPSFLHALIADHEVERLKNALDHLTSERDEARAEVERLTAHHSEMETHITCLTTELHRTRAHGITLRWVEGEVEQLTAQRDKAQAEVERLTAERDEATTKVKRVIAERDEAQGTIYRLAVERDAAQAEVERLTRAREALRDSLREALIERNDARYEAGQLRRDQSAQNLNTANGQAILDSSRPDDDHRAEVERLTAERDAALAEVERLIAERDTAQANVKWLIDRGNGKASLHRSRATDEDIWREAFMALCGQSLKEGYMIRAESADAALAVYRKRWPQWPEGFNVSNGCNAK
jgi:chromosome segregation ATPase